MGLCVQLAPHIHLQFGRALLLGRAMEAATAYTNTTQSIALRRAGLQTDAPKTTSNFIDKCTPVFLINCHAPAAHFCHLLSNPNWSTFDKT